MRGEHQTELSRSVRIIYEFGVHLFVGTVLFALIAVVALGVSYLLTVLSGPAADPFILLGLQTLKYMIFTTDFVIYAVFLIAQVRHTTRKLWQR
jgi:hypothetical protein